jgi:hypothetical protein
MAISDTKLDMKLQAVQAAQQAVMRPRSVRSEADCVAAVERVGFAWAFTPAPFLLPALFTALDTEDHGQCWDWMWGWKDTISASRQAYYGKVVAGKPTFVSLEWLPAFYALTGNTGDADDDLAQLAETTRVHELSHKVVRYLSEHGPTGTRTLSRKLTDGTRPMKTALSQALFQLDTSMLIAKSGAEGGNALGNVWDLFARMHPRAVEAGTEIPTRDAAHRLLRHFFTLTPAITTRNLERLFPWNPAHQQKAIARLLEAGELEPCTIEKKPGVHRTGFPVER